MRARIVSFDSPDVDVSGKVPLVAGDDGFLLTMVVGPSDGPGEETFDLVVCTAGWLGEHVREVGRPLVGRHYLIVETLDLSGVITFLRNQVESISAPTWTEIALKVGRLGRWEFEDYTP